MYMRSSICVQSWLSVPPANFEESVVAVGFAGEQRLHLALLRGLQQDGQRLLGLGHHLLVALLLAERDQLDIVVEAALKLGIGGDGVIEMLAFAHDGARPLRIVPEIGVFGERVQLGQTGIGFIPVKDASEAARGRP
jgi:hypothetical protein